MCIVETIKVISNGEYCAPNCPFLGKPEHCGSLTMIDCQIFRPSEDGLYYDEDERKPFRAHSCKKATGHVKPKPKTEITKGDVWIPNWLMDKKSLIGDNWRLGSIIRKTEKAIYFKDYMTNDAYWLPKTIIKFDDTKPTDEEKEFFYTCTCGKIKVKYLKGPHGENESPEGIWECDVCEDYYEWGT